MSFEGKHTFVQRQLPSWHIQSLALPLYIFKYGLDNYEAVCVISMNGPPVMCMKITRDGQKPIPGQYRCKIFRVKGEGTGPVETVIGEGDYPH